MHHRGEICRLETESLCVWCGLMVFFWVSAQCFTAEPKERPTAADLADQRKQLVPAMAAEIRSQRGQQERERVERQKLQQSFRPDEAKLGAMAPDAADRAAAEAALASLGEVPLEERAPDRPYSWGNGTLVPVSFECGS